MLIQNAGMIKINFLECTGNWNVTSLLFSGIHWNKKVPDSSYYFSYLLIEDTCCKMNTLTKAVLIASICIFLLSTDTEGGQESKMLSALRDNIVS